MATCAECVHVEVCKMHYRQKCELTYESEREVEIAMCKAQKAVDIECDYYKDRSRFVELPCKVGDILFVPTRNFISEYKIDYFHVGAYGIWFNTTLIAGISTHLRSENIESIGKTVFLTREESEQALKERESNGK